MPAFWPAPPKLKPTTVNRASVFFSFFSQWSSI